MPNPSTYQQRDKTIFGKIIDWSRQTGGIKRFPDSGIDLKTANSLLNNRLMYPGVQQNLAPSNGEMVEFGNRLERNASVDVRFHGYAVSPHRTDYRTSITGFEVSGNITSLLEGVIRDFGRTADDLNITSSSAYAWWD